MSFLLLEKGIRLSATVRSVALCLGNLRVLQPENLTFPFKALRMHSLMLFTISLLQFEIIALRSFGSAVLST